MTRRIALAWAAALLALALAACGGPERSCCGRTLALATGRTYQARLGNPDGGADTVATYLQRADGGATMTFQQGARVIEVRFGE